MDFKDVSSARDWADSWVAAHTPNLIRDEIAAFEAEHRERFLQAYGRAIDQFYVQYGALVQAWTLSTSSTVHTLAIASTHPIRDRREESERVPLDDGPIVERLRRRLDEHGARALRRVPPHHSRQREFGRSFRRDHGEAAVTDPEIQRHRNRQEQLRLDWMSNYAIMSVFAHGNVMEVTQSINRMHDRSLPPERLGLMFEPDVLVVETVLPFLSLVTLLYLRFVLEALDATSDVEDAPLIATCRDGVALLTFAMRDNSKPKWRMIADDIDYLFSVFAAPDAGGDWKSLRDARPPVTSDEPKS